LWGETVRSLDSILLGGVLILSCACIGPASAQCLDKPEIASLTRTYTGTYVNDAYGFSVQIPRDFVGRDVDNPLYQRGFTILSEDPDESLRVYADVNSLEWKNIDKAALEYARPFADDASKILSTTSHTTVLGGRHAVVVETRFLCRGSSTRYASMLILTLSADRRFVYALRWEGKLEEMGRGRQLLRSLRSSWRFREPKS
jgi:hypothetical protein